jgi:hypothetical protein
MIAESIPHGRGKKHASPPMSRCGMLVIGGDDTKCITHFQTPTWL